MIDFVYYKEQAERLLEKEKYLSTSARQCMRIIVSLCEEGQKLEAENADLKNELRRAGERY